MPLAVLFRPPLTDEGVIASERCCVAQQTYRQVSFIQPVEKYAHAMQEFSAAPLDLPVPYDRVGFRPRARGASPYVFSFEASSKLARWHGVKSVGFA